MHHAMAPVLAAALALSFLFGADAHGHARARTAQVRVPKVVGLRADEAVRALENAGLAVRLLGPNHGAGIRLVTAQRPAAGVRARAGSEVRVTYRWATFGGPPPAIPGRSKEVRIPKLAGCELREAVRRLQRVGLAADAVGPTAGRSGRALVVAQHPSAGRVMKRGGTVRLTWRLSR